MTLTPVLLITGPLGVGKTTVLDAVAERLRAVSVPFAAVDLDALAWASPPGPGDDPYRTNLMFQNLASVWHNFRASGASHLICAHVIESRDELERYRAAIPDAVITIVRLRASDEIVQQRLSRRLAHSDLIEGQVRIGELARRERRSKRSRELAAVMDRERPEDVLVDTDGRDVDAVAADVLRLAHWPGA